MRLIHDEQLERMIKFVKQKSNKKSFQMKATRKIQI